MGGFLLIFLPDVLYFFVKKGSIMTNSKTQKPMTDADANKKVIAMLKRGHRMRLGVSPHVLSLDNKTMLFIDNKEIHISENSGDVFAWVYQMQDDTAKLALSVYDKVKKEQEQKKKHREKTKKTIQGVWFVCLPVAVFGGILGAVVLGIVKIDADRKKIYNKKTQIDAYAKSLPNYEDSIRLARTDAELQNAINRREQTRLKIAHFADSLNHIK